MITHISFDSIPATDVQRARDFYVDKLGLAVGTDAPYGETRWIMLQIPGARTQIHLDHVAAMPETDKPALVLIDDDVAGTVDRLRGQAVEIVRDPGPAEWDAETTYSLFRDSEGNMILLASR